MNSLQLTTIQERDTNQQVDGKKMKCVAFCLEQNQIFPIYKSQNEYLTKKQKRKLAKRVSRALRGKGTEDSTSSEDEPLNPIDDESESYFSIVEWKKIQEDKLKKNEEKPKQKDQLKSALKKPCLINLTIQKDLIAAYEDILREELCQEQMETKLTKHMDKNNFMISDFAEIQQDNEEVHKNTFQISITLDELEDFGIYHYPKYDISNFDQIKKKIDNENKNYDIIHNCILYQLLQ